MRFVWFILLMLTVMTLVLYIVGNVININIFKDYRKQINSAFWKFLLVLILAYISFIVAGLVQ